MQTPQPSLDLASKYMGVPRGAPDPDTSVSTVADTFSRAYNNPRRTASPSDDEEDEEAEEEEDAVVSGGEEEEEAVAEEEVRRATAYSRAATSAKAAKRTTVSDASNDPIDWNSRDGPHRCLVA